MQVFDRIAPLRAALREARVAGQRVGLVPTMGALHEGHRSLIRRARAENEFVVVSLFVNPTQFGPNEDFARYPRAFDQDRQMAEAEGVDALFAPPVEEMYPPGFQTMVDVPELGSILEGAHRPGHFRGVTTVVTKLFAIVQPDRAYFGRKDYQQLSILRRMARDLDFPVEIVPCPTVREPDGLAMSSRNAYLSPEERREATVLYRALQMAEERVRAGARDPQALRQEMEAMIASEPDAQVDYVALVDPETLQPVADLSAGPTLAVLAVRIGKTRLIDNWLLPHS
ncbi:MAG TPA: pantoate--beta-alanine ligase [Chthonomonadaceae bacterium]|nr:pantoate--beta-alanine ligase [Chthonomonadaceae bacterium]